MGLRGFKPQTAGPQARMLPLCYAVPFSYFLQESFTSVAWNFEMTRTVKPKDAFRDGFSWITRNTKLANVLIISQGKYQGKLIRLEKLWRDSMQRRPVVDAVVQSTRDRQNVVKRGTFVAPGRDRCQLKYLSSDVGSETYKGVKLRRFP